MSRCQLSKIGANMLPFHKCPTFTPFVPYPALQAREQLTTIDTQANDVDEQLLEEPSVTAAPTAAATVPPSGAGGAKEEAAGAPLLPTGDAAAAAAVKAEEGVLPCGSAAVAAVGDIEMAEAVSEGMTGAAPMSVDPALGTQADGTVSGGGGEACLPALPLPLPSPSLSPARLLALRSSSLHLPPPVLERALLTANKALMQNATDRLLKLLPDHLAARVRGGLGQGGVAEEGLRGGAGAGAAGGVAG